MNGLAKLYDGWQGYQQSLVAAVTPLTVKQLQWRPTAQHRSAGELVRHISLARLTWFRRMNAPGSADLSELVPVWVSDTDGNQQIVEEALPIAEQAEELVSWLNSSWKIVDETLQSWEVSDLGRSYNHVWNGQTYVVSYQWTIWRILSHDIHHGGELSLMLGMQGIEAFELSDLFGHIILPPLA